MASDFFIFGPEGGETTEMGTSVGPNMLERYPVFLQPEPTPGDPAQLILNSPPPPPSTSPSFAAPPEVKFQPAFGPVTSSGYAEPTPSPESYYGGDIQPELSNVSTVARPPAQQPAAPAFPKQTGGGGQAKTPSKQLYAQIGDLLPGQAGARVGDPVPPDSFGNQWVWDLTRPELGYFKLPPAGGVEELTPEQVAKLLEGQTPTTSTGTTGAPGTGSPTPGTSTPDLLPTSPTVVPQFTVTPPTYFEPEKPDGYFPIDRTSQPSTPRPVRGIEYTPLNPLRTVPLPQRATDDFIPESYNTPNYIQYDPDEILAAAMRAIGNQRIRQSIVDQAMENRMLERMRG